ncbi:chymotrypsin-elastase inhibitor ixodidin-like isoform X1 [Leptopilina boulardi]|uniref:chymotrypsin-elastase inhibitor ixodidin-like isoform X1 n=1 Tax=Leptopilina boulardi TaxID=63433 RepID=UPI0021F657FB|nr:chymotrypsin-elastase inhibitor ixodidin-like isoform X1 [Leptopilina boulardi]
MAPLFIYFSIVLIVSATTINAQPGEIHDSRCGRYAVWDSCASYCPVNCEGLIDPNPIVCPPVCVEGCVCIPGYIRRNLRDPNCIPEKDCPNIKPKNCV